MKRVVRLRLTLALIVASMIMVSANATTNAADTRINFMSTNGSSMESVLMGDYDFGLYNRTSGWVLNGFYTKEDGKWSQNWLTVKLAPGKSFQMAWSSASNSGDCVVPFKTTWDDYDKAEVYNLDWCKGIKNIYLKDEAFTVDYK